jgi:hypothetical protein
MQARGPQNSLHKAVLIQPAEQQFYIAVNRLSNAGRTETTRYIIFARYCISRTSDWEGNVPFLYLRRFDADHIDRAETNNT